jgi:hypothetical protein
VTPKRIIKVAISIPNEGHTLPEPYGNRNLMMLHLGMLQLASKCGIKEYEGIPFDIPEGVEYQFFYSNVGRILTPLARERLSEWGIRCGAEYLFMLDDDMMCPMNLFELLIKHDVDIVAPLAFMRLAPHNPVLYRIDNGYDPIQKLEYYIPKTVPNYPKNTLVECDGVGFGVALIKTKIFEHLAKPWFMSTTGHGEDLLFCRKAKEAGFRVFMDTSVKLGHMGIPPIIYEEDFERESKNDELRKTHGDWQRNDPEMHCGKRAI